MASTSGRAAKAEAPRAPQLLVGLLVGVVLLGVGPTAASGSTLPPPVGPEPTAAQVDLGRRLFFARELSADQRVACADCHRPEHAFTDGRARAVGIGGAVHPRSAMSLTYAAWSPALGWTDPKQRELEDQVLVPLFGPGEMGVLGYEAEVLRRLEAVSWRRAWLAAFGDEVATIERVAAAIAAFERTLARFDAPFDRWLAGTGTLDAPALEGWRLFHSRRIGCAGCHGGLLFGGPIRHAGAPDVVADFRNTGLRGDDPGLAAHTARPADRFRFRVPTLRNVSRTAPYMHDGRFATLDDVLDHYASGPALRDPAADPGLVGFTLSAAERAALVAFLRALDDSEVGLPTAVGPG